MTVPATPADLRRGFLAHLAGDLADAEALYRRCLSEPALESAAQRHLIHLLESQHRFEDAILESRDSVRRHPEAPELRAHLSTLLLGQGRYQEAWPLFEARAALEAGEVRPNPPYPEWDGRPIGSLTVWDEQGFGDAIQFARFVPVLVDRGITVTLVVRPELASLFAGLGAAVIPAKGQMKVPLADAWAMLGSLPYRLGVTLDDLPGRTGYVATPEDRKSKWAGKIGPGARIGVVARGKAGHVNNSNRSLPAEGAAFLLSLPGAVNLLPKESPLPLADFADSAAVVDQLDLVIAVDTAVVHLAGAMGKPCWVLLPYEGVDWRWLRDGRTDSPWYPSLRLYRQPSPGDWASALRAVAQDLPAFFGQAR